MAAVTDPASPADATWDAGSLGCGELLVLLRGRMQALAPGQVLALVARDPGAIEDLPAWCRLTGHVLLRAEHPVYHLRRRS
jgi:tRNA 2-thiouridine synthesizing protein A